MSTIISLSGRRLVSAYRFTGLLNARLNQDSSRHISGATFQYNLSQYSEKPSLSNGQPISFRRQIFYMSDLEFPRVISDDIKEELPIYKDKDAYYERLYKYVEDPANDSITLEDFKSACYLASTKTDLDLIEKIVLAIARRQPMDPRWSAILMRLYYKFDEVDRAYNNFKDVKKFQTFFDSFTSHKLLMIMLYLQGRYEEVVEVCELSDGKFQSDRIGFGSVQLQMNPSLSLIAIAALAKQLKPGSFEKASSLIDKQYIGYYRYRMDVLLLYIAIQENQPTAALDFIASMSKTENSKVRDLKGLALLQLGRYEDIIYHLRNILSRHLRSRRTNEYAIHQDVYKEYKDCLNNIEDGQLRQNFKEIIEEIERQNLVISRDLETSIFDTMMKKSEFMEKKAREDGGQEVDMKSRRRGREMTSP